MEPGDRVLVDTAPTDPATIVCRVGSPTWAKPEQVEWFNVTFATGCTRCVRVERLTLISEEEYERLSGPAIVSHCASKSHCLGRLVDGVHVCEAGT